MPKYLVDIAVTATLHMDADNEQDARAKAAALLDDCDCANLGAIDGAPALATLAFMGTPDASTFVVEIDGGAR